VFYLRYLSAGLRRRKGRQPRGIGFGLAVGILMDTFVFGLLVPSTVILFGRWNWRPSQRARRGDHHPRPLPRRTPSLPHRRYRFRRLRGAGEGMTRVGLLALVAAVAVLVVSAAGCGGTAADTSSTTATVAGASPPPKLSKQRRARKRALTKLARCMRAHGASFPDPTPDGRIAGGMATVTAAINGPNGQQALSACYSDVLAVQATLGGAYGP
jgi:MMPL family